MAERDISDLSPDEPDIPDLSPDELLRQSAAVRRRTEIALAKSLRRQGVLSDYEQPAETPAMRSWYRAKPPVAYLWGGAFRFGISVVPDSGEQGVAGAEGDKLN